MPGANRLNAAERSPRSAELAVARGAPLASKGRRFLAQEPAAGSSANARDATTGPTEWITRLSVSSAFEDRSYSHRQKPRPPAPWEKLAGLRGALLCPEPARSAAEVARTPSSTIRPTPPQPTRRSRTLRIDVAMSRQLRPLLELL